MLDKIKKFAKPWVLLIIGLVLVILITVSLLSRNAFIEKTKPLLVGQCLIQYNSCAFMKEKGEPWENTCVPVQKSFEIIQTGDQKVLVKDIANGLKMVFPKMLIRDNSRESDSAITNSLYLYLGTCEAVSIIDSQKDLKVDVKQTDSDEQKTATIEDLSNKDKFPETSWESLNDHCVAEKRDCATVERWEEERYCHPYLASYKILEVGKKNLRVVVWHGSGIMENGKIQQVGTEKMMNQEEYLEKPYVIVDCGEMVSKYAKGFNPIKGK
jgi:hypothetical protein